MGDASDVDHTKVKDELKELTSLIDPSEIVLPTSSSYISNSQPWSIAKDKHPQLLVRPKSIQSLSEIVAHLAKTKLSYRVRCQGFGSVSADHVLISLHAFDDFEFNQDEQYVILGAGQAWKTYYERMDQTAPDWAIVAARTPSIGVGGSTLSGGFSWLSSQYGCVSDPSNLLDAHVVLADGSHFWAAAQDPDLLWSLRASGGGGFAIVTHFKFRARHFPQNGQLWGGPILIPRTKVAEVAKGVVSMVEKDARAEEEQPSTKGKTSMFLYVMRKELLAFIGATQDMLVIHGFDERGTEAGRKEFKWALEMDGAIDQTKGDMTLSDVSKLQEHIGELRGTASSYWSPVALTAATNTVLTESTILKAFSWWEETLLKEPASIGNYSYLLFELFTCCDNLTGRGSSAWPRPPKYTHQVLLGTGCAADAPKEDDKRARQLIIDGHQTIFGRDVRDLDIVPNALEDFHNIERVYGEHYQKLREIKTRVDPDDRLGGWFRPLSS